MELRGFPVNMHLIYTIKVLKEKNTNCIHDFVKLYLQILLIHETIQFFTF